MTHSDEQRLAELLKRRRELNGRDEDEDKRVERDIVDIIYRHLYDALRPQFLARYGATVGEAHPGTRFTDLLNEFFVRVLTRFPDALARLNTAKDLRGYVAQSLTNLMRDHLGRAKHERSGNDELLACLIEERQQQLQRDCPEVEFDEVMARLAAWSQGDPRHRRLAEILQRQYVSGDDADTVQRDLGISRSAFFRLRAEAFRELRRDLQPPPARGADA
jgi:DNA-directed RNA polymerase specialized sigma24 family protein